jgi:hypothetical protein
VVRVTLRAKHARREDNDAIEISIFATIRLRPTVGLATWSVIDWSIKCHPVRARCGGNHVSVFKTSFSKLIVTKYSQDDSLAEILALNRENIC